MRTSDWNGKIWESLFVLDNKTFTLQGYVMSRFKSSNSLPYPNTASFEGSKQTSRLELAAFNSIFFLHAHERKVTSSPEMHVEFRGDREDQGEFTAFYFRWIRLVGVSHRRILESIT